MSRYSNAPVWRKEPPTVEEVEGQYGGMGQAPWWWREDEGDISPCVTMLGIRDGVVSTFAGTKPIASLGGEWAPCLPPPADVDLAALRERVRESESVLLDARFRYAAQHPGRSARFDAALATLRELAARVGIGS